MPEDRVLRVGLTGGIASGKSLAAKMFEARGAAIIDTDLLARDVVAPGTPGLSAVIEAFGTEFLNPDGSLNRKLLRDEIFARPESRTKLESIIHPLIREAVVSRSSLAPGPYQIIAIPLLAETGFTDLIDRVLVVDCAPEIQLKRLIERDHESRDSAQKILAAQASRQKRLAIADDVIDNNGSVAELEDKVAKLHATYVAMAADRTKASENR